MEVLFNMSEKNLSLLVDQYISKETGENVTGITIMIDGYLKKVMDIMITNEKMYETYAEIVRDSLFAGLKQLTENLRKDM